MESCLKSINNTASWFGDPVLPEAELKSFVDNIFTLYDVSKTGTLSYAEYANAVTEVSCVARPRRAVCRPLTSPPQHPVLVQFMDGKGTHKYGSGGLEKITQ